MGYCDMFKNSQFNGDISKWDVSKALNMNNMFENAAFDQDISNWKIPTDAYTSGMFKNAKYSHPKPHIKEEVRTPHPEPSNPADPIQPQKPTEQPHTDTKHDTPPYKNYFSDINRPPQPPFSRWYGDNTMQPPFNPSSPPNQPPYPPYPHPIMHPHQPPFQPFGDPRSLFQNPFPPNPHQPHPNAQVHRTTIPNAISEEDRTYLADAVIRNTGIVKVGHTKPENKRYPVVSLYDLHKNRIWTRAIVNMKQGLFDSVTISPRGTIYIKGIIPNLRSDITTILLKLDFQGNHIWSALFDENLSPISYDIEIVG